MGGSPTVENCLSHAERQENDRSRDGIIVAYEGTRRNVEEQSLGLLDTAGRSGGRASCPRRRRGAFVSRVTLRPRTNLAALQPLGMDVVRHL